ncbi:hypothetical protein BLNAU_16812 [Blattamonas nauphoetae]|uniref:Uncharacterized protein n=1 Tax=Blattamonas nauphoetae TaxID=2049346 RepID=A0ABQ9X809_9EUKA|nr:hypothetical protein BLNAU_16812 [Blattamonas nauphoetae]
MSSSIETQYTLYDNLPPRLVEYTVSHIPHSAHQNEFFHVCGQIGTVEALEILNEPGTNGEYLMANITSFSNLSLVAIRSVGQEYLIGGSEIFISGPLLREKMEWNPRAIVLYGLEMPRDITRDGVMKALSMFKDIYWMNLSAKLSTGGILPAFGISSSFLFLDTSQLPIRHQSMVQFLEEITPSGPGTTTRFSELVDTLKKEVYLTEDDLRQLSSLLKDFKPSNQSAFNVASFVKDLCCSNGHTCQQFIDGIYTLLSSNHPEIASETTRFLNWVSMDVPASTKLRLACANLVEHILSALSQNSTPTWECYLAYPGFPSFLSSFLVLNAPHNLKMLEMQRNVDKRTVREAIFINVLYPSKGYLTILLANHHCFANRSQLEQFAILLLLIVDVSVYHRPTLDFTLSLPIGCVLANILATTSDETIAHRIVLLMTTFHDNWRGQGHDTAQNGKTIIARLGQEGVSDAVEQRLFTRTKLSLPSLVQRDSDALGRAWGINTAKPQKGLSALRRDGRRRIRAITLKAITMFDIDDDEIPLR